LGKRTHFIYVLYLLHTEGIKYTAGHLSPEWDISAM